MPIAILGDLHQIEEWAGLKTIVMVKRVRHLWNKTTRETMVYLTSLPCDAVVIGRAIRTHWGIENHSTGCSMSPGTRISLGFDEATGARTWRSCDVSFGYQRVEPGKLKETKSQAEGKAGLNES